MSYDISQRFPVAAYAARLSPERRDRFALFAQSRPYDATLHGMRAGPRHSR